MQDINVTEGQTIIVGDTSIMIERIDFNSKKSFVVYTLSEESSSSEQFILHVGRMIELMPQALLAVLRIGRTTEETYAVMGLDTSHEISVTS